MKKIHHAGIALTVVGLLGGIPLSAQALSYATDATPSLHERIQRSMNSTHQSYEEVKASSQKAWDALPTQEKASVTTAVTASNARSGANSAVNAVQHKADDLKQQGQDKANEAEQKAANLQQQAADKANEAQQQAANLQQQAADRANEAKQNAADLKDRATQAAQGSRGAAGEQSRSAIDTVRDKRMTCLRAHSMRRPS